MNKVYARLKVLSKTLSPEEIANQLGMESDSEWKAGDRRANTIIVENENGWVVNSGLTPENSLDEHIDSLLKRLSPASNKLRELSKENTLEFSCVIYSSESPALYFEKGIVEAICRIGANLDIDTYNI